MHTSTFYSHGKLLLTGEYVVLDGAKAVGLPTKFGQSLHVSETSEKQVIHWKSQLHDQGLWMDVHIHWSANLVFSSHHTSAEAQKLVEIFQWIACQNPLLFSSEKGYAFLSILEFPKNWGLGSSSTLINNLAQWANLNAFALQEIAFGGSGYDVACAQHATPILFQKSSHHPLILPLHFSPLFKEEIFFVHLNKKQNSRHAIHHYRSQSTADIAMAVQRIDSITEQMIETTQLDTFEKLVKSHEKIIASLLVQPPIQQVLFADYPRVVKSLGAWGGDFVLATGNAKNKRYFQEKGYTSILSYSEMIL